MRVIDARHRAGFDHYNSFPWMSIHLNIPSATENYRAERGFFKADAFFGSLGRHRTFEIRNDNSLRYEDRKILIWGPYQTLNPGRYSLEIMLEPIRGDFEIPFDIMADNGERTILEGVMQVRSDHNPQLNFYIDEPAYNFEFRLIGDKSFPLRPFRFMGFEFIKQSTIRGIHQAEAMMLLARLVEYRMRHAYTVEVL